MSPTDVVQLFTYAVLFQATLMIVRGVLVPRRFLLLEEKAEEPTVRMMVAQSGTKFWEPPKELLETDSGRADAEFLCRQMELAGLQVRRPALSYDDLLSIATTKEALASRLCEQGAHVYEFGRRECIFCDEPEDDPRAGFPLTKELR